MEDGPSNLEDFTQTSTQLTLEMDASQRRLAESQRCLEESQREIEESQRRRDELLQRMVQAVEAMQAESVCIDETHS